MVRPHERFPRPAAAYYERRFPYLSQGDILEDVPFAHLGPELLYLEGSPGVILQPIVARRGLIVSRTCDFRRPSASELSRDPGIDPYEVQDYVMVSPVLPLSDVAQGWGEKQDSNLHLAREYDALRRVMYLPPLPGEGDQEFLIDLSQVTTLSLGLVIKLHRVAQLTFTAAQQLQYKLVMAATGVVSERSAYQPPMD